MLKTYQKMKKLNNDRVKVPRSVQDTIPVDSIYSDGIFCIGNRYSKSFRFMDINYSIASKSDKKDLFIKYEELLNSFDSSVMAKITVNNRKVDLI